MSKVSTRHKKTAQEKKIEKLLTFWIGEKKGLGLKKTQFDCGLKKNSVSLILRRFRKEKKVFYKQRRWFISEEFYNLFKETCRGRADSHESS